MKPTKIRLNNVFSAATEASSEEGGRITKNEFFQSVSALTGVGGRLTGALVHRIRRDWEALGKSGVHPGTPEAIEAYRLFVLRFGPLALLELLAPREERAA